MRFLHLSDLHLGKRLCEFSMLEEQRYILEEILTLLDETPVDGVLLAATAGAINVRLGGEALRPREAGDSGWPSDGDLDSGVTPGRPAEVGHLRSVVGLVWRAVVVWMLLLALLTLARLLG